MPPPVSCLFSERKSVVAVAKGMKIRLRVNGTETRKLRGEYGWGERGCSCLSRKRGRRIVGCQTGM